VCVCVCVCYFVTSENSGVSYIIAFLSR